MDLAKTILIIASNPADTPRLALKDEFNAIKDGLKRYNRGTQINLVSIWETRQIEIHQSILEHKPQIIHFIGHGAGNAGLVFEDTYGESVFVTGQALAKLFKVKAIQVHLECVVLNACYTEVQANEISEYVNYVVGIDQSIPDRVARTFSIGLYDTLGAGHSFEDAFEIGCAVVAGLDVSSDYFHLKKNFLTRHLEQAY